MELIAELAEAAFQRDGLRLRSLVQDITRANDNWSAAISVLEFKNSDLIFGYSFRKCGAPYLVLQVSELGALTPFKRS
jgi:hypothetical protein